jgi:uncharacterized RDD family membrane protein YckC
LRPPAIPDDDVWPANDPDRTDGVLLRRAVAYFLDLAFIGCLWFVAVVALSGASLVTFGLLSGGFALLVALPVAYHVLTIGLQGATWGQHLLGLVVCDRTLSPPSLLQALVSTVLFYLTVPPTGGLILLAALFLPGRRTLHDVLAGTVVLRRRSGPIR